MARKGKIEKFETNAREERIFKPRKYKYLFLIVCEDEKTEPDYFNKFKSQIPEESIYLETIGTGFDPKGIVKKAIDERLKLEGKFKREVDETWVVFDKDDADENETKITNFDEAFTNAAANNIEIAYSNEVFEVWLLLHLKNIDSEKTLPRNEVYKLLESQIKKTKKYSDFIYDHKKPNSQTIDIIFELGNLDLAIERAKLLLEKQKNKKPIEANPSTKVHVLVQELQSWIRYFSE